MNPANLSSQTFDSEGSVSGIYDVSLWALLLLLLFIYECDHVRWGIVVIIIIHGVVIVKHIVPQLPWPVGVCVCVCVQYIEAVPLAQELNLST